MQTGREARPAAKFVTGSIMRHVCVMSATGSIGTLANFSVDAINLFYIAMLGVASVTAAVGFAAQLLFFPLAVAIGFMIACSALVARRLGQSEPAAAAGNAGAAMAFSTLLLAIVAALSWPFLGPLAGLLGARGAALADATLFLRIAMPSAPLLGAAMCCTGILRGAGDARRAMLVTLSAAAATALLDPLLIFGLHLGLPGAAISMVLSRLVMLAVGLHGAMRVHRLLLWPRLANLRALAPPIFAIGLPVIVTQLATPVGNSLVTIAIARFGDEAVVGWTVISRVMPIAFAGIYALSGAIGPIFSQNFGAGQYRRLRIVARDGLLASTAYVAAAWALLALFARPVAALFGATGMAGSLVMFFCTIACGSFLFTGALFIASAAFNNLGCPRLSTWFNWARATIGIVPLIYAGGYYFGPVGIIGGWAAGAVLFGSAAYAVCLARIGALQASS